jgi:hypothetical protein
MSCARATGNHGTSMSCTHATGREVQNQLKEVISAAGTGWPSGTAAQAHRARLHSVFTRYRSSAFQRNRPLFSAQNLELNKNWQGGGGGTLPFSAAASEASAMLVAGDSELEDLGSSPCVSCSCGCSAPLTGAPVTSTNLTSGLAGCCRGRTGCCGLREDRRR